MKFDSYTIIARIFPAALSAVPFFVLHYYLITPFLGNFWKDLLAAKIISDVTFSLALLFFLVQTCRISAKEIFEKRIYNDGLNFPTTEFLLHLNEHFSSDYTKKIHKKIKSDFNIIIPSLHEEITNPIQCRKRICEAINHIRRKVGQGILVGQHNKEFGFVRNLAGGSVISISATFLNIIIFTWIYQSYNAYIVSFVSFFLYLVLLLSSKKIIKITGISYAKVLIQEYMTG